jgi:hypothetical protein
MQRRTSFNRTAGRTAAGMRHNHRGSQLHRPSASRAWSRDPYERYELRHQTSMYDGLQRGRRAQHVGRGSRSSSSSSSRRGSERSASRAGWSSSNQRLSQGRHQMYDGLSKSKRRSSPKHPRGHAYPQPPLNPFVWAAEHSDAGCIPVRDATQELGSIKKSMGTAPPAVRERFARELEKAKEGRHSATRFWGSVFPENGLPRHELLDECGPKCFISPGNEAYPICTDLDVEASNPAAQCWPMKQGIQAAFNRSHQYKHSGIADVAEDLRSHECQKSLSPAQVKSYMNALKRAKG